MSLRRPLGSLAPLVLLVLPLFAAGQTKMVFLVRHAERASSAPDSPLSDAGQRRADCLGSTLKDAGIHSIFTTQYQRTQQTAAPLAKLLSLRPASLPADDQPALIERIQAASGNVLVVAHSDTLPAILQKLGIAQAVSIRSDEYDQLFVVTMGQGVPPAMAVLHYCEFSPPPASTEAPMIRK